MTFPAGTHKVGANLSSTAATAEHALGTEVVGDDGATYRYIKAASAISANDLLTQPGTTLDNLGPCSAVAQRVRGVAPAAIASGSFGWVAVRGPATVKVAAATPANSALGTTATAGTGGALSASATYVQAEITAAIAAAGGIGIMTVTAEAAGKATAVLG